MQISKTEALVLQQLVAAAGSELYGLEMVKASERAKESGGSESVLKMGTIYVILGRLQDKGLVESRREELSEDSKRPPRRLYKITGTGARALHAYEAAQAAYAAV